MSVNLSRVLTPSQISLRPYYPRPAASDASAADHVVVQNIVSLVSLAMIVAIVAYLVRRM